MVRRLRSRSSGGATSGSTRASRPGPEWRYDETHGGPAARRRLQQRVRRAPGGATRSGGCGSRDPGPAGIFDAAGLRPGRDDAAGAAAPDRQRRPSAPLLRTWVAASTGDGTGTVEEFEALAAQVSGQDLDGFFDAWLHTGRRPARTAANGLAEPDRPWSAAGPVSKMGAMADYRTEHARSIEDPEGYWAEQAGLVDWIKKPQQVLDDDHPPFYRWFPDATLNTCFNALDRHVVARPRRPHRADLRQRRSPDTQAHASPTPQLLERGRRLRRCAARVRRRARATGW